LVAGEIWANSPNAFVWTRE